jgi:hypothetical protein
VLNTVEWKGHRLVSSDYSLKCVEKLFGNSQARANRLTINRIIAA